jgi:Aspartyl protease
MKLIGKLLVLWDLFANWLGDTRLGRLVFRPGFLMSTATFPIEIHDNHLHVLAQANRSRPLSLILDTGADYNALNASLSEALGIKQKIDIKVRGAGTGEDTTTIALTKTICLSLMEIPLRANILAPFVQLEAGIGRPIDGILGAEIFSKCVVEIDYLAQVITLYPAATYHAPDRGAVIPFQLTGRRPFIQAWIQFPGQEAIEGKFIIDTGDSSGLSLHTPFVQQHNLLSYAGQVIPHYTYGIAGQAQEYLGRAESLRIGEYVFAQPITALSQAGTGSTADKSYDGAIGGEILRRFKLTLDYTRQQMILEPNPNFDAPFEVDMSGMVLAAQGQDYKTIQVWRIYDNTPAAWAGLSEGDTLLEIDAQPVAKLGLEGIKQMFKVEGQAYILHIEREGQPMQISLTTRRLV